ncbi:MAG: hypothetical protein K2X39_03790 [Silvanigrellaceae bacterium]|nr:hypothetical protein [Silvanigrellaceae bacterium]
MKQHFFVFIVVFLLSNALCFAEVLFYVASLPRVSEKHKINDINNAQRGLEKILQISKAKLNTTPIYELKLQSSHYLLESSSFSGGFVRYGSETSNGILIKFKIASTVKSIQENCQEQYENQIFIDSYEFKKEKGLLKSTKWYGGSLFDLSIEPSLGIREDGISPLVALLKTGLSEIKDSRPKKSEKWVYLNPDGSLENSMENLIAYKEAKCWDNGNYLLRLVN